MMEALATSNDWRVRYAPWLHAVQQLILVAFHYIDCWFWQATDASLFHLPYAVSLQGSFLISGSAMYWRLKDQSEENFLKFRQLGPKVIAQQAEALEGATEVSLLSLAVFEIVDASRRCESWNRSRSTWLKSTREVAYLTTKSWPWLEDPPFIQDLNMMLVENLCFHGKILHL